jgi:hypothetical protein
MGYENDRQIEQDEHEWDYRDGTAICFRCLSDPYLRKMVKDQASEELQRHVDRRPVLPHTRGGQEKK